MRRGRAHTLAACLHAVSKIELPLHIFGVCVLAGYDFDFERSFDVRVAELRSDGDKGDLG